MGPLSAGMAAKSTKVLVSSESCYQAHTIIEMKLIHRLVCELPLLMISVCIEDGLVRVRRQLRHTCIRSQSTTLRHLYNGVLCAADENMCASRLARLGAVSERDLGLIRTSIAGRDHPVGGRVERGDRVRIRRFDEYL